MSMIWFSRRGMRVDVLAVVVVAIGEEGFEELGVQVGWQLLLSKNHVTDFSVAPNGTGQEKG